MAQDLFISASIAVPDTGVSLDGTLEGPGDAGGLVIFAHGSGSSRFSPRNRHVAARFQKRGFATLLFDLLTEAESADRANVFDIPLLAGRVLDALRWARACPETKVMPVGLFGASTGAAAALVAAAAPGAEVRAVVSRGGRPDLAANALGKVVAPTLLIVGGRDAGVIELNQAAFDELECEKRLEIVPGATHLFEEPGTLDAVVELAVDWFDGHLGPPGGR